MKRYIIVRVHNNIREYLGVTFTGDWCWSTTLHTLAFTSPDYAFGVSLVYGGNVIELCEV